MIPKVFFTILPTCKLDLFTNPSLDYHSCTRNQSKSKNVVLQVMVLLVVVVLLVTLATSITRLSTITTTIIANITTAVVTVSDTVTMAIKTTITTNKSLLLMWKSSQQLKSKQESRYSAATFQSLRKHGHSGICHIGNTVSFTNALIFKMRVCIVHVLFRESIAYS